MEKKNRTLETKNRELKTKTRDLETKNRTLEAQLLQFTNGIPVQTALETLKSQRNQLNAEIQNECPICMFTGGAHDTYCTMRNRSDTTTV